MGQYHYRFGIPKYLLSQNGIHFVDGMRELHDAMELTM